MTIVLIAWRNIGRNRRRSILSIAAVAGAMALLVFMMAFQKGSYLSMINTTVHAHSGHIQLQRTGYFKDGDLALKLDNPEALSPILRSIKEIVAFAPRINAPALVSKDAKTFGSLIWGIDPVAEANTSTLTKVIKKGKYLSAEDKTGALLSDLLAKNLNADIGDEIVFIGQGADGSMAAGKLFVRGIFKFGINEIDRVVMAAHIETIQEIFSLQDSASEIAVILDSDSARPLVIDSLKQRLAERSFDNITVLGWNDISPEIEQSIEIDWKTGLIMYAVLVLVVGFGIANTFFMAFMERIHEYGILLSLGMKSLTVSLMTYIESALLSAIGIALGAVVGIAVTEYFAKKGLTIPDAEDLFAEYGMDPVVYPALSAEVLVIATAIVGIITAAMALYPAWKAGRLEPVKALRRI
ncbi:MAG: ABC transporter permease [Lentisphaerae bacterium]|nr:ABC transporter permease [Lentisphaerota bacterium]